STARDREVAARAEKIPAAILASLRGRKTREQNQPKIESLCLTDTEAQPLGFRITQNTPNTVTTRPPVHSDPVKTLNLPEWLRRYSTRTPGSAVLKCFSGFRPFTALAQKPRRIALRLCSSKAQLSSKKCNQLQIRAIRKLSYEPPIKGFNAG